MSRILIHVFTLSTLIALGTPEKEFRERFIVTQDIEGNLKFDDLRRTPLKNSASADDLTFYLHTKQNENNPQTIAPSKGLDALLKSDYYDPTRLNVFLIHGLNNNHQSSFNTEILPALLEQHNVNVFVADWSGPANKFYTTALSAVPIIGQALGNFIKAMMDVYQLNGEDFRLIGHSLGAHVCGAAGSELKGELGYIIGLDPAGPLISENNLEKRLDKTDAKYVEVIHTSAGKLGYEDPMGHVDFYPNGGRKQVGCILDLFGICAHSRAYLYYAESLMTSNFVGFQCDNYGHFENAKCDQNPKAVMGQFDVNLRSEGDFYLDTAKKEPFALGV